MNSADPRTRSVLERYFEIPADQQQALLDKLEFETLEGGRWLFHQGDSGDSLFLLIRGRLQVWQEADESGPLDEPVLLGRVTPDESVGEIALLTGAPRSAGIRAVRDSQLIRIRREIFEDLAHTFPSLVMKLAGRAASLVAHPAAYSSGSTRNLNAIALVPLDNSERSTDFCKQLASSLAVYGATRTLQSADLHQLTGADTLSDDHPAVLDKLVSEIQQLEDQHKMLLFQCDSDATAWTQFALRQSDLVILVGESQRDASLRHWERSTSLSDVDSVQRRALVLLHPPDRQPIAHTASWLDYRPIDFHLHVTLGRNKDVQRVARVIAGKAVGLVLGSGASRGFAHLGVYRALCENEIPLDWVGGSSIGAIMGAGMAHQWAAEETIDVVRRAFVGGKPFSDYTLPIVSLLAGKRMSGLIHDIVQTQIEDLPLPFYCVSSNLDDGSVNIHSRGSMATALQSTVSMPGIFPPAVFGRRLVVDGSVLNSLPVDLMWQQPVGKVLAVDLAAHRRHEVEYKQTPGAAAVLRSRMLPWSKRVRVPNLTTVMLKSTELATMQDMKAQGGRASLLLKPDVKRFGLTQVRSFDEIVEQGYRCAMENLQDIKQLVSV